jgi:hypothetical protein
MKRFLLTRFIAFQNIYDDVLLFLNAPFTMNINFITIFFEKLSSAHGKIDKADKRNEENKAKHVFSDVDPKDFRLQIY